MSQQQTTQATAHDFIKHAALKFYLFRSLPGSLIFLLFIILQISKASVIRKIKYLCNFHEACKL